LLLKGIEEAFEELSIYSGEVEVFVDRFKGENEKGRLLPKEGEHEKGLK
jgi:hypothetical protein